MFKKLTLVVVLALTLLILPTSVLGATWENTDSFTPSVSGSWTIGIATLNAWNTTGTISGSTYKVSNPGEYIENTRDLPDYGQYRYNWNGYVDESHGYTSFTHTWMVGGPGPVGTSETQTCTHINRAWSKIDTAPVGVSYASTRLTSISGCQGVSGTGHVKISIGGTGGAVTVDAKAWVGTWSSYKTSPDLNMVSVSSLSWIGGGPISTNNIVVESSGDNFATTTDTLTVSGLGVNGTVDISALQADDYFRFKYYCSSQNCMTPATLLFSNTTNFTITSEDIYGATIYDFNADVNGTSYVSNITTGRVTTNIRGDSTASLNPEIRKVGYVNRTYTGWVPNVNGSNLLAILTPVALILDFDMNAQGNYSINGESYSFNSTGILTIPGTLLALGHQTTVMFNSIQQFKFFYDEVSNAILNKNISVATPDLEIRVRAIGLPSPLGTNQQLIAGGMLHNARIEAQVLINDSWRTSYAELTDQFGYANLLVKSGQMHRIVGFANGFNSNFDIRNIYDGFDSEIVLKLTTTAVSGGTTIITNDCSATVTESPTYCNIDITAPSTTGVISTFIEDSFGINHTDSSTQGVINIVNLEVSTSTGNQNIFIYLDGVLDRVIVINFDDYLMRSIQIMPNAQHMQDYPFVWWMLILILGGAMGAFVETRIQGFGVRAFAATFLLFGMVHWQFLFIPAIWITIEGMHIARRVFA